jgi:hypothetical protein
MGCYGNDRNHSSPGAIIPKNPVGARCFLLDISFKDLLPVRAFEGSKFVRVQRWMPRSGFEKPQAFPDGFENILLRRVIFNLPKVGVGLWCEDQFVHRFLFGIFGKRSSLDGSLLRKPGEDFF